MVIVRPNPKRQGNDPTDMPFLVEFPPMMFGYTQRPSEAWLRTPDQFVLLYTDHGIVGKECIEMALAILEEMRDLPLQTGHEDVKLRAVYKSLHNGFAAYVDYFIDLGYEASMTKKELLGLLYHQQRGGYDGQCIIVHASLHRESMDLDSYAPLDEVYYDTDFSV